MGVTRTNRAVARATGASCPNWEVISISLYLVGARSAPPRTAVVLDVPTEGARGRELAELVPDHRLRHEHRDVLAAVVDGDRVPDHLREDRRGARPRLDHHLVAGLVHLLDPRHEAVLDERSLLGRARHLTTSDPSCHGDGRARCSG